MKFLVDAQLPLKLCEILENSGFESTHVDFLPKGDETTDIEIARHADEQEWIIMTKDADFYHSHMISRKPEKLFLITTGNLKNRALFDLIRRHATAIKEQLKDCSFIEMTNDKLIGHK